MSDSARSRILFVDDESEITAILTDLFEGQYECTTAGSAEEALERIRENDFDLVVSDITMPGLSGLEMIPHVKSTGAEYCGCHDQRHADRRKRDRRFETGGL